ncbi:MAG: radical SAM protein [Treponemataceae bacterium]|nr:radical SAM protein [Treponemataceae bacterium]
MNLFSFYDACTLCPRGCGVNRNKGERGFCGETAALRVGVANIHKGEEPPITGLGGSGTIFVTGCTLGCLFCQNWQVSQHGMGRVVEPDELACIMLALQKVGAENINIVTGSHALPALCEGVVVARREGLEIPILWNSSAYESVEAVEAGAPYIDVYLPDLKTLDAEISCRYFHAPDYGEKAQKAILKMIELKPLVYGPSRYQNKKGGSEGQEKNNTGSEQEVQVLRQGVVIRHLVLPGQLEATRQVLEWFTNHAQGKALLSLMTQYTPVYQGGHISQGSIPDRYVNPQEFELLMRWLDEYEIDGGFYQELVQDDAWLPDFNRINPFSSELSVPVWHWRVGFVHPSGNRLNILE